SSDSISAGAPKAKPTRSPASAYDLEKVRRIRRFSCDLSRSRQDSGAKSTYASSITTMPVDAATTSATAPLSNSAPVGEFGLTTNLSGEGSGPRLGGSSQCSSVGWRDGLTSWIRHRGSKSGYVGVG